MLWFGGIHGDKQLGMRNWKNYRRRRYLQPFAKSAGISCAKRKKDWWRKNFCAN